MPAALATPLRHCARRYASSSVSAEEVAYFSARAASWWDASGEFGLLHRMNAARFSFLRDTLQRDQTSELPPLFLKGRTLLDVGCGGGLFAEVSGSLLRPP
jgi:2-polyprenyl-3-methyl-5-hydroxy-6-metoxy-1,4-benzoquinol methylase